MSRTNVELGFPLRLYSYGYEPKPEKSINYHSKTEFLESVENVVGEEVWNSILNSSLGVVIRFVGNKFTWSSKIVEHILSNQLACRKKHEMWCLLGNTPARFSLSEFENLTNLNCAPFPESGDVSKSKVHKELWIKLKVTRKNPSKKELKGALEDVPNWSIEDKIRFAYLSILATVIIGEDEKKELPSALARMVFDLSKFEKYPWGREDFKRLIESVKRVNLDAKSYTIDGFVQTLQVWAYDVVPRLGVKIGRPLSVEGPPILKFKGLKGTNNIDIHVVSIADEKNIKSVFMNSVTPVFWDDKIKDEKIDNLLQAICKEEGLGVVTWVEKGINTNQMDYNKADNACGEFGEMDENIGESNSEKTSLKRTIKMKTSCSKKFKSADSGIPNSSMEIVESLCLKVEELEKKSKRFETMEIELENMQKTLQSFEIMHSKIELMEKELIILRKISKTAENFTKYQLKDSSEETMSLKELFATLNDIKQRKDESDGESVVAERYTTTKIHKEQMQQSSPVKIFQPTISVAEKFMEKKVEKTLKVMEENDNANIAREKSKRVTKPGPSLLTPFRSTIPTVGIKKELHHSMMVVGRGYDPFAQVDLQKIKILDDWLQLDEEYPIGSQNNAVTFFKVLRTPQGWLNEEHINSAMNLLRLRFMKNQKVFRSGRIAFTDAYFTAIWSKSYKDFLNAKEVPIFPNGAFDYASGKLPSYAETGKKWRIDVDDIYAVLHVSENHWVALIISIPNGTINVLDCGLAVNKNDVIVKAVNPIAHMLPHLLRVTAPLAERAKISVEKYKIRRPRKGIPQMLKSGDCGIYAVKFIECHALGVDFTTPISDPNIQMVREKLAAKIFDETEQHGRAVSNSFPF